MSPQREASGPRRDRSAASSCWQALEPGRPEPVPVSCFLTTLSRNPALRVLSCASGYEGAGAASSWAARPCASCGPPATGRTGGRGGESTAGRTAAAGAVAAASALPGGGAASGAASRVPGPSGVPRRGGSGGGCRAGTRRGARDATSYAWERRAARGRRAGPTDGETARTAAGAGAGRACASPGQRAAACRLRRAAGRDDRDGAARRQGHAGSWCGASRSAGSLSARHGRDGGRTLPRGGCRASRRGSRHGGGTAARAPRRHVPP